MEISKTNKILALLTLLVVILLAVTVDSKLEEVMALNTFWLIEGCVSFVSIVAIFTPVKVAYNA